MNTLTSEQLDLPPKGTDINAWIDKEVRGRGESNNGGFLTADEALTHEAAADIARGAVLLAISDKTTLIANLEKAGYRVSPPGRRLYSDGIYPAGAQIAADAQLTHEQNVAAGWWSDLTTGEPTPLGSVPVRIAEAASANAALGNPWRENLGLPNRSLEPTLDNRRALASVFRRVRPRLIFAPFWEDAHPDHTAATKLVEDARFWSKLSKSDIPGEPFHPSRVLYYFSVHLRIVERPSFVLDVSDHVDAKLAALRSYRTQLPDPLIDSVLDRTRFWGHAIGVRHGEPFASREPIGLTGFGGLLL